MVHVEPSGSGPAHTKPSNTLHHSPNKQSSSPLHLSFIPSVLGNWQVAGDRPVLHTRPLLQVGVPRSDPGDVQFSSSPPVAEPPQPVPSPPSKPKRAPRAQQSFNLDMFEDSYGTRAAT
jgi:hypothetical protein